MYDDFLISFIINLINTVIGYLVSKKYFNSDNSTFYQMIYGTMFIRFMILLSLMLFLMNYQYQFDSFVGYLLGYYNPKTQAGIQQNEIINTFAGPGIQLLIVFNH